MIHQLVDRVLGRCQVNPSGRGAQKFTPPLPGAPNPSPVPARKTQRSGATFRRAVFSAKEVPGAQDLSPRAQTHLPFGCSVVGVMWKPKASLNLQKKIFISRSVYGSWSAGCQNRPLVQWICTGLQICKRRFNPLYRATEVFLHFLSLDSATHRSFLHFLSLNLQKKIFISRSVYGSWSAVCQNWPLVQWICTGLQICKRRFNPLYQATEVFLHFLSLGSATHRSFLHFLSLNLQKKKLFFFFPSKNKSERKVHCPQSRNEHRTSRGKR